MVFLAAGLGGGTGTGAAPVIAKALKKADILTVAVGTLNFLAQLGDFLSNFFFFCMAVTKPFDFEGGLRRRIARQGLRELHSHVDTMLVVPNQNLVRICVSR